MARATEPRTEKATNGRWLVPALFVGFVLFTVGMSFGTVILARAMRPTLERRQIERQKAEMREEAANAPRAASRSSRSSRPATDPR